MSEFTTTKVFVASVNQGKISCVKDAFSQWNFGWGEKKTTTTKTTFIVQGVANIPSGVSDQPMTFEETCQGATNRATALRTKRRKEQQEEAEARIKAGDMSNQQQRQEFFVGLESGVIVRHCNKTNEKSVAEEEEVEVFDFCACSILTLSAEQTPVTGISQMFPLPKKVAASFLNKNNKKTYLEYNPSFEEAGIEPDSNGDGVLAVLSDNHLTRPIQMKASVDICLMQLVNKFYS